MAAEREVSRDEVGTVARHLGGVRFAAFGSVQLRLGEQS